MGKHGLKENFSLEFDDSGWPYLIFELKLNIVIWVSLDFYSYEVHIFDRLEALWNFMKDEDSSPEVIAQLFEQISRPLSA